MLEQLKLLILPYEVYTLQGYKNTFDSLQAYEEDKHLKELAKQVDPSGNRRSYAKVRNYLLKFSKLYHPQTMNDLIAIRNVKKSMKKKEHQKQHVEMMLKAKLQSVFQGKKEEIKCCSHDDSEFNEDKFEKLRYDIPEDVSD